MIEDYEFNITRPMLIRDEICKEIETMFFGIIFDTREFSPEIKELVKQDSIIEAQKIYDSNEQLRIKHKAGCSVRAWHLRSFKEIFWYTYKGHFMEVKLYMDFNFINDERAYMDLYYRSKYTVDILTTMKHNDSGLVDKIEQFSKRRGKNGPDENEYLLADRILSFYTQQISEYEFKFKLQACVMSDPVSYKK